MVLSMCLCVDTLTALFINPYHSGLLSKPGSFLFSPATKRDVLQFYTLACIPIISTILTDKTCISLFITCNADFLFSFLPIFPVPSASMTRLARSRTASLTSASSMDGSRSRACTHSDSTEGVGTVTHTMEVSC